jgi:hypothetical protein
VPRPGRRPDAPVAPAGAERVPVAIHLYLQAAARSSAA